MRLFDVNLQVLEEVISHLGPEFYTKDVSENEEMVREHQEFVDEDKDAFDTTVGEVITKYHDFLKVNEVEKGAARGSRWQRK